MQLTSMKLEPKTEKTPGEVLYASDCPKMEYPYGLEIRLEEEALKKLGMTLPKVGDELMLTAKVKVCSTSSHEYEKGGERRSLALQITDMGLGAE